MTLHPLNVNPWVNMAALWLIITAITMMESVYYNRKFRRFRAGDEVRIHRRYPR